MVYVAGGGHFWLAVKRPMETTPTAFYRHPDELMK
jgi:hypothetical protein